MGPAIGFHSHADGEMVFAAPDPSVGFGVGALDEPGVEATS